MDQQETHDIQYKEVQSHQIKHEPVMSLLQRNLMVPFAESITS